MKILLPFILLINYCFAQNNLQAPTTVQLKWHQLSYYWFIHFGPNTFTNVEWGKGTEKEEIFNPQKLNCNEWCSIAKAAGAKQIIITAKHHDGFCLWPSKFSNHTVAQSKWRNGKGDVLKELSAACKKYGLKFGVYISPWDRNHPDYGTDKYNEVFVNMMKELFTNYGTITELWWDGANGESPNGKKQVYDWKRFKETVKKLSPSTVIFSDVGPDIRWCGNENGFAGTTNYNYLNTDGFEPGLLAPTTDTLNKGNENGKYYIPAECDVSIRPGWFYHKTEDDKVKTPQQLFNIYLKSVGRGGNLLLNIPPDENGLITKYDSAALMGFKKLRDKNFEKNILQNTNQKFNDVVFSKQNKQINFSFNNVKKINCIVLTEQLINGQNINSLLIELGNKKGVFKKIYVSTIGNKRIITFPAIEASTLSIKILNQKNTAILSKIEVYLIDESLIEK